MKRAGENGGSAQTAERTAARTPDAYSGIRAADPTDHFEARINGGYKVNAREWETDAIVRHFEKLKAEAEDSSQ